MVRIIENSICWNVSVNIIIIIILNVLVFNVKYKDWEKRMGRNEFYLSISEEN